MNKNNKGFTLVELLAAIVILGIMVFYAAPRIADMLDVNKNKVYVNDAKKMIAQTEYKLKANSSTMEKPTEGNCIVVTMLFLDADDFDSPPNQGEYVKESSFVVVKNIGNGALEYSAAIVEKVGKGGYKGVNLSTSDELKQRNATKNVKLFKKEELFSVAKLSKDYINNYLGPNYVNGVDNIYNYPDMSDSYDKKSLVIPNIVSASLSSASNKEYNSLDAVFTMKVVDLDSLKSDIRIYISEEGYADSPEGSGKVLANSPINYSSMDPFKVNIDFSDPNRYPGAPVYTYDGSMILLYVIAKDENDNEDRKIVEYRLHSNLPPVISNEKSKIEKLPTDMVNMTTARLTLAVTDDADDVKDLQVCFTEDAEATTCNNYQSYGSYFGDGNTFEYTFNRDKCNLNGDELNLKVFVKDSFGEEVSKTFDYKLHKNLPPTITSVEIKPVKERFTTTGSLNVYVKVNAKDDITLKSNIKIEFTDKIQEPEKFNYNEDVEKEFTFGGGYDGKERTLYVTAEDECGLKTSYYKNGVEGVKHQVYGNKPPVIDEVVINSRDSACKNLDYGEVCEKAKSKDTTISFKVTDDINYNDNYKDVMVCVSPNRSYCNDKSHFSSYANYYNPFVRDMAGETNDKPYDGKNRYFYIFAEDQDHAVSEYTISYPIYKNGPPKITDFRVESKPERFLKSKSNPSNEEAQAECEDPEGCEDQQGGEEQPTDDEPQAEAEVVEEDVGSLDTFVYIDGVDDLDDFKNLRYHIKEKNGNEISGDLRDYDANEGIPFTLKTPYDGTKREITIELTDDYGEKATASKSYLVYKNEAPVINTFELESFTNGCDEEHTCVSGNHFRAKLNLSVSDDMDSNISTDLDCEAFDRFGKCISTCENYDSENDVCMDNCEHYDPEADMCCKNWNETKGECEDETSCVLNAQGKKVPAEDVDEPDSKIMACVSEDPHYCDENNTSHFKTYSDFINPCDEESQIFVFNKNSQFPFDGEEKTLYLTVVDSLGAVAKKEIKYPLYANEAPVIEENYLRIMSEDNAFNVNDSKAIYEVVATDDLTRSEDLQVQICYTEGDDPTEKCLGGYQPYQESYNIDFGITDFHGQVLHVFSRVKDTYGKQTTSISIDYKLHADITPEITSAQAAYMIPDNPDDRVGFSVIAKDPFDTYQICITKTDDPNTCTFSGSYDGTDLLSRNVYITDPDILVYDAHTQSSTTETTTEEEGEDPGSGESGGGSGSGSSAEGTEIVCEDGYIANDAGTECIPDPYKNLNVYYVFVKDSHGKISTSAEVKAAKYQQCEQLDSSTINYQFTLLSSQGITHQRCGGRCYYYDPLTMNLDRSQYPDIQSTASISANYKKKTFANDSFRNSITCAPEEEDYEAHCDFYQCFQTGANAYNGEVIGVYLATLPAEESWFYKDAEGHDHEETQYYTVYTTSYNPKNGEKITYNPTRNRYPKWYVANLTYNSSSARPYLRILDNVKEEEDN